MELCIPVELSRGKGIPCVWEEGGSTKSGNGEATIVTDKNGLPKTALTVKDRYNGKHALIPVELGDFIIRVSRARNEFFIVVGKIVDFDLKNPAKTICGVLATYGEDTWTSPELPARIIPNLDKAVEAARCKSADILCSRPYYIQPFKPREKIPQKYASEGHLFNLV